MTTTAQRTTVTAIPLTGTAQDIRHASPHQPHAYQFLSAYSVMKHGGAHAAEAFARHVYEALQEQTPWVEDTERPIVLPVSYVHVPPSCMFIAQGVARRLNETRTAKGLPEARLVRIRKDSVAFVNYAASPLEERQAEMDRIRLTLEHPIPQDALVLIVDDVRITGLTEQSLIDATAGPDTPVVCAYVAAIDDTLRQEPHVEAAMNLFHVRHPQDMLTRIQGGPTEFNLTIRYLKQVLGLPPEDVRQFLHATPDWFVAACRDGARGTGPHFEEHYADSVAVLYKEADRRGL